MSQIAAARQRRIRDMLAGDIGVLRVMFHEAGQKTLCPPIPNIAHDIAERYGVRDPADYNALLDLLAAAQPAGTHQVADFNILSRILRKHRHVQVQAAHDELLQKQRRMTAEREGGGSSPRGARVASASPTRKASSSIAAAPAPPTGGAAAPSAAVLRTGAPSEWAAFLRQCAGNPAARTMSWPHFAAAVQAASFNSSIGRVDMWHARQHFLASCTGGVDNVHGTAAPISRLAYVTQPTDLPRGGGGSRSSAGTKAALSWGGAAGRSAAPPPDAAAFAPDLRAAPIAEPRLHDPLRRPESATGLVAHRSSTRADRLRSTAISSMRKNEVLQEESIRRGLPIPLLRAKIPLPPPMPTDPKDWKAPTGRPRVRPATAR